MFLSTFFHDVVKAFEQSNPGEAALQKLDWSAAFLRPSMQFSLISIGDFIRAAITQKCLVYRLSHVINLRKS